MSAHAHSSYFPEKEARKRVFMGGKRLLSHLGLTPSVVRRLEEASFLYDEDVKGLTPTELTEGNFLELLNHL